ncbi:MULTISPECIES: hypothetical protein [unclassified Nocardia]|uniref:hypothetical protein n=1 Tax=unclassified Nocardia TaxID=2637762 RepID=UPI0030E1B45C
MTTTSQSSEQETADSSKADKATAPSRATASKRVSLRLSTLATAAVVVVSCTGSAILGLLLWQSHSDVSGRDRAAADTHRAEQAATDYAVGAATVNYQDFAAWIGKLKAGTTPQLATTFDATAPKLEQVLAPLKWTSSATPIAAKTRSTAGSVYTVDVFVNVSSTSAQTPDGSQTTVTYTVTVDRSQDWKITDVGGASAALPAK